MAERQVQVIEDHARLEAGGLDTVILARRRDEVATLNELAHAQVVAEGRVHGPGLTVGDKGYPVGDRVICLANERSGAVSNGTRGVVTEVDVERRTLTLERPDKRQLTLDTTHYDAIDRGYALTVHKAQGMTADIALVVGSEGATREWAYTAMSRATLATHYYEVPSRPERDTLGVEHWKEASRSAEERTVQAWSRSELKEAALDYPERYETAERITAEDEPPGPGNRSAACPSRDPRRNRAGPGGDPGGGREEIDRLVTRRAYDHVERQLRQRGMSEEAARERLAHAVDPHAGGRRRRRAAQPPRGQGRRRLAHPRDRCAAGSFAAGVRARAGDVARCGAVVRLTRSNTQRQYRRPYVRAWEQFTGSAPDRPMSDWRHPTVPQASIPQHLERSLKEGSGVEGWLRDGANARRVREVGSCDVSSIGDVAC